MKSSSFISMLARVRSRSAETLAEVIIAITVLTLGTGSATILVTTSIRATGSGENRLVAYNLAREGVEAVRNIRDTNWLRFPGDRDDCWDTYDVTDPNDCATTSNKLGDTTSGGKNLALSPDLTGPSTLFKWNVSELTSLPTGTQLYTIDTNGSAEGGTFYTQDPNAGGTLTPYSRVVNVQKSTTPDQLLVTATVTWEENNQPVSIHFMDKLINY